LIEFTFVGDESIDFGIENSSKVALPLDFGSISNPRLSLWVLLFAPFSNDLFQIVDFI